MTKNLGVIDRIIRFIGGILLLYLGFFVIDGVVLKILVIIIGIISFIESFISYCGIYQLLRINTFKKR